MSARARRSGRLELVEPDAGDARAVRFPSAGQRALAGVAAKQLWIAGELGVSVPYVSQLRSGARQPSLDVAIEIEERFAIPARWWRVDLAASKPRAVDVDRAGAQGDDQEQAR
jgi:DNA-binding transcriptional regulator YdaS (Cro superfamily)